MKTRKQKAKQKDFRKVKLKLGKRLPKAANETTTAFKSRSISLKEQLQNCDSDSQHKLNLKELLPKCKHYSSSMRSEAVSGLRELFISNPASIVSNLSVFLDKVSGLCLDSDPLVRQGLLRLYTSVMPQIPHDQIAPFFPILSTYLCCAMTHIHDDIQQDSLSLLDVFLEHFPDLVTDKRCYLLPNFIEQISRKNQTGSGKGSGSTAGNSRSLLINPSSKLSSQKWRIKVLIRLQKFLQAAIKHYKIEDDNAIVCDSESAARSQTSCDTGDLRDIRWNHNGPIHILVRSHSAKDACIGQGYLIRDATDSSTDKDRDMFSSVDQLKSFIDIIIPLLIQCWIEVGPSQLATNLPGNALNEDAISMLSGVIGVLQSLLQIVSYHSNRPGNDLISWLKKDYEKSFVQHLLPNFPYEKHERSIKKEKHKKSIDKELKPAEISTQSLNLAICDIMANFVQNSSTKQDARWLGRLTDYITQTLEEQKISNTDLFSALRFVRRILDLPAIADKRSALLEAVYLCQASKNILSKDKLALLHFYAGVIGTSKQTMISSPPVQKWMQSIPKLASQLKSCTPSRKRSDIAECLLRMFKLVGTQKHSSFLDSLQEYSLDILDQVLGGEYEENIKRLGVELIQILHRIEQRHLQCFVYHIFSQSISTSITQYVVDIVTHRYLRDFDRGFGNSVAPEDLLSFLFTLISGTQHEELKPASQMDKHITVTTICDAEIITKWPLRQGVAQIGCQALNQLPNSKQTWIIFRKHAAKILVTSDAIPIYTVNCICSALHCVQFKYASTLEVTVVGQAIKSLLLSSHNLLFGDENVDVKHLCTCAQETAFKLLASHPRLLNSFWDHMSYNYSDRTIEEIIVHCRCLISMFDYDPLVTISGTWAEKLVELTETMKKYHEEITRHNEWSDLQYKVSLIK